MKVKANLTTKTLEYLDSKPYIQGEDSRNKLIVYVDANVSLTNIQIAYQLQNGRNTIKLINDGIIADDVDTENADYLEGYNGFVFNAPLSVTNVAGNFFATVIFTISTNVYKINVLNTVLKAVDFENFENALESEKADLIAFMNSTAACITIIEQDLKKILATTSTMANDVVQDYSVLLSYPTSDLPDGFRVLVMNDINYYNNPVLYQWNGTAWENKGYFDWTGYINAKFDNYKETLDTYIDGKFDIQDGHIDDRLDAQDQTIAGLGQLRPSGVDTSAHILAFTEDKGIYIGTDTGYWYYWDTADEEYKSGGTYQATAIADGSVSYEALKTSICYGSALNGTITIDTTKKEIQVSQTGLQFSSLRKHWSNMFQVVTNAGVFTYSGNTPTIQMYMDITDGTFMVEETALDDVGSEYIFIGQLYNGRIFNSICLDNIYVDGYGRGGWYRDEIELTIPDEIRIFKNTQIDLHLYQMLKTGTPYRYSVDVEKTYNLFDVGVTDKFLRLYSENIGVEYLLIKIYRDNILICYKKVKVRCIDTKTTQKAIFIGDSFTEMGFYLAELKTMMGNDLVLYGTRETTAKNSNNDDVVVNHEGRGGWYSWNYVHQSANNPFYNNGTFDFSYYMTNNPSFNDVTDVYIVLGMNGQDYDDLVIMINSIVNYNSNIKLHLGLMPKVAGCQYQFGTVWKRSEVKNNDSIQNYWINMINNYPKAVMISNVVLDEWYDYNRTIVDNYYARNHEQIEIISDVIHPNKYGFYKMADAMLPYTTKSTNILSFDDLSNFTDEKATHTIDSSDNTIVVSTSGSQTRAYTEFDYTPTKNGVLSVKNVSGDFSFLIVYHESGGDTVADINTNVNTVGYVYNVNLTANITYHIRLMASGYSSAITNDEKFQLWVNEGATPLPYEDYYD